MMSKSQRRSIIESALSVSVLVIILIYSYAQIWVIPYPGFDFYIDDGTITRVLSAETAGMEIHPGDVLLRVDSVYLATYKNTPGISLFGGVQPGDIVLLQVLRGVETVRYNLLISCIFCAICV